MPDTATAIKEMNLLRGKSGKMHYYYKCGSSKRNKGCKRKAVKKDWIERLVVYWTVKRVLQDEEIHRIAEKRQF